MDDLSDAGASPRSPRPERWNANLWAAARRLSPPRADRILGLRSAAILPTATRARFAAMGLPPETVEQTLREIRALEDWPEAWTRSAQRFLGESRREDHGGHRREAAVARRHAAFCYHAALLAGAGDPRTARALRASATGLFAQTVPILMPAVRRVEIPWRTTPLPGYLLSPGADAAPAPVAVLLNGATTAKEETILWADRFLREGIAVLALDWPGTGEATSLGVAADCDDMTDGLLALSAGESELDEHRVALVGFSLGTAVAIRAAVHDRRIAACVAVTPPFDATRWLDRANPLIVEQFGGLAGEERDIWELAAAFALPDLMRRLRCPLLVFGAGRDLVTPPGEALNLAAAAGALGTLVWYPRGRHGLYEALTDWTDDAARWLVALLATDEAPTSDPQSTRVEATAFAGGSRRDG